MRFIKKHKYKLLTLMLSIVSIFTLFLGINKTYAYETFDNFSETIEIDLINMGANVNSITYDSTEKYYAINITINNSFDIARIYFTNNETFNYNLWGYYSLLCNCILYNSSNTNPIAYDSDRYINVGFASENTYQGYSISWYFNRQLLIDNKYYSLAIVPTNLNSSWYINTNNNNCINFQFSWTGTYTLRLYNCDMFEKGDLTYKYIYDKYYGQIAENYEQLQSDYNDLQDNYDTLNTQYLNLQQEVVDLNRQLNALRNSYNSLLNEYNLLKDNIDNVYNSGSFYYVDYVDSYLSDDVSYTNRYSQYKKYSLTDLVSNQFIVGGNLNIQNLCLNIRVEGENGDYVSDYPLYLALDFNFIDNIPVKNVDFELIDFSNTGVEFNSFVVTNGYSTYTISLSNSIRHITYDVLFTNSSVDLTDYYLDSWSFICKAIYGNDFPYINSNYSVDSLTYNEGYYDGYNNGIKYVNNSNNERITYLENELSSLESQIDDLNAMITTKNLVIESLNEQIDSFNSDYNLNNLMWTIAGTPFESFKRIWNVEFFGVNISSIITGFLTGIIVLWIIKKFFL